MYLAISSSHQVHISCNWFHAVFASSIDRYINPLVPYTTNPAAAAPIIPKAAAYFASAYLISTHSPTIFYRTLLPTCPAAPVWLALGLAEALEASDAELTDSTEEMMDAAAEEAAKEAAEEAAGILVVGSGEVAASEMPCSWALARKVRRKRARSFVETIVDVGGLRFERC
jgi:hypothetical protein